VLLRSERPGGGALGDAAEVAERLAREERGGHRRDVSGLLREHVQQQPAERLLRVWVRVRVRVRLRVKVRDRVRIS